MFSTRPSARTTVYDSDEASDTWYHAPPPYAGLQVSQSSASHSNSPQSSDGSLVCTPYNGGGSLAEISSGDSPFGYTRLGAGSLIQPSSTGSMVGLGLHVPEPRKTSPLGGPPSGLNNFNIVPMDCVQGPQNQDMIWHDSNTRYAAEAGSSYLGLYTQTPTRHHPTVHSRSYSDNAALTSSMHFSPQGSPFGADSDLPSTSSRSFSQPPPVSDGFMLPPLDSNWNDNQYHCMVPNYQNDTALATSDDGNFVQGGSHQWLSPVQPCEELTPTSPMNEDEASHLFQSRVGSDRTRAISHSRRSNPDKKLFHCPIPGCGATITSKHNYKSHYNSHYGIKPHACGQGRCSKRFGTTAEVKRHRANHCQYRS